jgi:hypothetical protein
VLDFLSLGSLFAGDNLENDFLTFAQRFEPVPKDCGVVNEHILAAILGNEAKALFIVPPFDFASSHKLSPE